ncbi:MAG: hypothetical protein HGN29_07030 [Asgard group archaeon]|nr:hypothetical protein [Asgard group archaeon]
MKKFQKAASITELIFQEEIKRGVQTTLIVKGYLGDPSWKLLPETLDFDEDRKIVKIRLFAKKEPNTIAIQVIKDFKKEFLLTFLSGGKWTVHCNTKSIEIEVEE